MGNKKYLRRKLSQGTVQNVEKVNYDVSKSMIDLLQMLDLVRIKFDNHIDLAKKDYRGCASLTGLQQQFMKFYSSIEKLNA